MIGVTEKCIFCGTTNGLEKHHCIHGTANRKLADKDGLVVYICHECHMKLHQDPKYRWMDNVLKEMAEVYWMGNQRGFLSEDDAVEAFRCRYGKNYL